MDILYYNDHFELKQIFYYNDLLEYHQVLNMNSIKSLMSSIYKKLFIMVKIKI